MIGHLSMQPVKTIIVMKSYNNSMNILPKVQTKYIAQVHIMSHGTSILPFFVIFQF